MIKTFEHAEKVQLNRVANGKRGHSKAVRAFCKRNRNLDNLNDYNEYLLLKAKLPFALIKPEPKV